MAAIAGMPDPLDPIKKPQQAPQPVGLDPYEGVKNMARDAASAVRGAGQSAAGVVQGAMPAPMPPSSLPSFSNTVQPAVQAADAALRAAPEAASRGWKAVTGAAGGVGAAVSTAARSAGGAVLDATNTPTPAAKPLMGPDAGSSILPTLQKLDTHMRERTAAVPGLLSDAGKTFAAQVAPPSSNYVGNGPTDPDTNGRKPAPGVDLRVAAGQLVDRVGAGLFGSDYQRELTQTPKMDPFAYRPAAPAPTATAPATPAQPTAPAPTVTPPAAASAPAPLAKPSPEQSVQLQALISKQNNNRTPVSDPYAPVPGSQAAPTAGMPAPGGGGADLNGTPSQQTAYWAQQKAGLEERGRYADAQATQQQAFNMMQADQDFKAKILEDIKANGEKYGPATMQALASLAGVSSGAQAPASAGTTGLASMANHMGMAAGEAEKNALTARGQDLTYAGHLLTGTNDMAKAKLNAEVQREGHGAQKEIHAGNNASAQQRAETAANAAKYGYDKTQETALTGRDVWKQDAADPRYAVNGAGQRRRYVELGAPPPKK